MNADQVRKPDRTKEMGGKHDQLTARIIGVCHEVYNEPGYEQMVRQHESQTLQYLRATPVEVAVLMNFGPAPRFKRVVINSELKAPKRRSVESVTIGVTLLDSAEPSAAPEMMP